MKNLSADQFEYQGFFHLPDRRGQPRVNKFAGGGHAMCYNAGNNSLFVAGHPHYDLVAEVKVPKLSADPDAHPENRATTARDFFDCAPGGYMLDRKRFTLDTLGGLHLSGNDLLSTWFRYYSVVDLNLIDDPTLARVELDKDEDEYESFHLEHIGKKESPFHQRATSGFMFGVPADFLLGTGGENLVACGRGDGGANVNSPKGPALFVFNPLKPENARVLIYRPLDSEPPTWHACDRWRGGAWVRAGDREAVVFVGEKGLSPWWYGQDDMPDKQPEWFPGPSETWRERWKAEGRFDKWRSHKGYHCVRRETQINLFSTSDLAASTLNNPLAYSSSALDVFHEATLPGACCYDEEGRRFFVWEYWPIERTSTHFPGGDPRIHVWKVVEIDDDDSSEEEEEEEEEESTGYRLKSPGGAVSEYEDDEAGRLKLIHEVSK